MHGIRLLTGGFQVRALAVEAFPVDTIKAIAVEKNRSGTLFNHQFLSVPLFSLQVLTASRQYIFDGSMQPQVDHIFHLPSEARTTTTRPCGRPLEPPANTRRGEQLQTRQAPQGLLPE